MTGMVASETREMQITCIPVTDPRFYASLIPQESISPRILMTERFMWFASQEA